MIYFFLVQIEMILLEAQWGICIFSWCANLTHSYRDRIASINFSFPPKKSNGKISCYIITRNFHHIKNYKELYSTPTLNMLINCSLYITWKFNSIDTCCTAICFVLISLCLLFQRLLGYLIRVYYYNKGSIT